uniref:Malate dehydrogenase n=1 Tax=Anthurium amnicola TaxID=1678845 RepID=A0A1D1YX62_9ARAE
MALRAVEGTPLTRLEQCARPRLIFHGSLHVRVPLAPARRPGHAIAMALAGRVATALPPVFLTGSTALALRRAKDASGAAFAAGACLTLLIFLRSARELERQRAPGGAGATRLKVWTWASAAALNGMFSYRVAGTMPSPVVAAAVWVVSGVTTLSAFLLLFFHHKKVMDRN